MNIRPYQAADDPALMAIEYRSPRGASAPFVHYRRCFSDRAAIFPDHQLFVAETDQTVIGCIAVAVKQVQIGGAFHLIGYIFDLRVDPDYRRNGLGTVLVQHVENYLFERGAVGAYGDIVSVNVASLKLFEALGYQRIRQLLYLEYPPISYWTPNIRIESDAEDDQIRFTPIADRDFFTTEMPATVAAYDYMRWFHDSDEAGYASVSIFDQSRLYRQVLLDDLLLPDEVLQRQARSLRIFDFIGAEGAELMQAVFDSVRDYALNNLYYKLSAVVDAEDTLPGFVFEAAEEQKRYWMVFKSFYRDFEPEWTSPFYVDAREI